ncbi:nucleolar and coiled-body phosphoprotein 1-like isoform X1 [Hippoglossus hippoglossus]|uniref:nucleolar and coiled-body phosphoprotein 1-like isoform X1 n=1 Tax=Hippoglossus hippoglossus TaxID=8267 RepID=UPI00148C753D|nr:nucleolar and coiled-body phosphoprotein 1-like isoform X1 [Hippoglossus hippoglossus]
MALRYFLACWLVPSCLVSGEPLAYGLLGQKVHLKPTITGHPDDILWKHDGNKVVEFNGKEEQVYSHYQSRVTLDWVSAELDITDLRHEDSGKYVLETYVNKEMHRFYYKLEVIDKVTKPSVSCDVNSSSSDTRGAWATLTCSAEPTQPQSLMKYEWESSGNVLPGPQLTILLEDEPDDKTYTCRVSNPLTFETTTFAAKTCSSDESSSVALAVSLSIFFIFLLLLLLAVVFCKLKNKACFAKSNRDDLEKSSSPTEERDQDDEKTHFLDRATTLPSNQPLRPLVPDYSDTATDLPDDNHREHEAADSDKGEESKKEEDEIEDEKSPAANGLSPPSLPLPLKSPDKETEVTAGEREDDANLDQVHGETESHSPNLEKRTEPDESTEEDRPSTAPEHNTSETASCEHHPKLSEEETHAKEDDQPEMDKNVSGGKRESDGEETENLCEDTSQSPTPKNTDKTQTNLFEKSPNAALPGPDHQVEGESRPESECEGQLDSSAAEEEDDEGKTEEDRPSTSPEPNMPETASGEHHSKLPEGETHAKEDDQPEMEKTVSGDNRETDGEETENPYSVTSQSPTPKNTDNTQTNTFEKSPNAKIPDPDHQVEGESRHDAECEGKLDSSAAEEEDGEGKTEEKMKDECDPKEEKPDNKSESEDKEGEKKTEAVEK